jgi:hypothetical protein
MNIKSKQGLVLLDAILADNTWNKHSDVLGSIFKDVDIDSLSHLISTEINGEDVIYDYYELLVNDEFLVDLFK